MPILDLHDALAVRSDDMQAVGLQSLRRIGDAEAPGTIAAAVYAGYRAATYLGEDHRAEAEAARRERPLV